MWVFNDNEGDCVFNLFALGEVRSNPQQVNFHRSMIFVDRFHTIVNFYQVSFSFLCRKVTFLTTFLRQTYLPFTCLTAMYDGWTGSDMTTYEN